MSHFGISYILNNFAAKEYYRLSIETDPSSLTNEFITPIKHSTDPSRFFFFLILVLKLLFHEAYFRSFLMTGCFSLQIFVCSLLQILA